MCSKCSLELRLDRGTLHGGHNYTVSCRAVRESDAAQVASGSVALSVASKGLEVKFPAREITYGSDNAVLLDGSLAADLGRNSVLLLQNFNKTLSKLYVYN